MHALSSVVPAATTMLSPRQQHRLVTANLVIRALHLCGLNMFGADGELASLAPIATGGFRFNQGGAGAAPVNMGSPVYGRERLLPGFRGSYAAQRILRCLVSYIETGRSMPAGMLARALMGAGNHHFHQVEGHFERVMDEFRFSRVFLKPVKGARGMIE